MSVNESNYVTHSVVNVTQYKQIDWMIEKLNETKANSKLVFYGICI